MFDKPTEQVNCKGDVNDLQFLNVDEKFTTFTFVSNKVDGYVDKDWQLLKQDEKFVAATLLSNNPDGIELIFVNEKLSVNVVADVEKSNKSAGIDVIPVERIKLPKVIIFSNPSYPTAIVPEAGIDVTLVHP